MSNPTPAAKPAPAKPRALDETDAVPVRRLMFRESVDVPGEQGIRSLGSNERAGKPLYEIQWLPRVDKYLVRASERRAADVIKPTCVFTIPGAWAIAEFEQS